MIGDCVAAEGRQVAEQLRRVALRRRDRRPRQRLQRVDPVVRRLRHDLVVHAVGRVQPLVRRRLAGAGQRDQRRLRHVLLRQPDLPRLGAVHVDLHRRVLHLLVHMDIHRARNRRNLLGQLRAPARSCPRRGPITCRSIGAGKPKSRIWFVMFAGVKKNSPSGNFCLQIVAQQPHVLLRVLLARLQRNLDVAIGVRDRRRVAEGKVDAAVRQPDVVEDQLDSSAGITSESPSRPPRSTARSPRAAGPRGGST